MTTDTLAIRAAVEGILNELDLRAFVFTFEAKEHRPALHVECASNGAWRTIVLPVDRSQLLTSVSDPQDNGVDDVTHLHCVIATPGPAAGR
jgi:hypothetical protein